MKKVGISKVPLSQFYPRLFIFNERSLPLSRLKSELFSAFAYPRLSKSAKNVSKLAKFAGLGHKSIAGFKKSNYICSSCVRGEHLLYYS
jgi:hypothetical protein